MTLKEHFGDVKGKTLSWVGDGNNVLHDLMIGSLKLVSSRLNVFTTFLAQMQNKC